MFFYIAFFLIFVGIFLTLLFLETKDSRGKANNALLIYYFGVAIWATTCLSGVFYQVYSIVDYKPQANKIESTRRSTRSSRLSKNKPRVNSHYNLVFWGLIIVGGIYVVRRPEWAGMFIDGIGAFKGKDLDRSKEMLITHAIHNPEDRHWAQGLLLALEGKQESSSEEITFAPPEEKSFPIDTEPS